MRQLVLLVGCLVGSCLMGGVLGQAQVVSTGESATRVSAANDSATSGSVAGGAQGAGGAAGGSIAKDESATELPAKGSEPVFQLPGLSGGILGQLGAGGAPDGEELTLHGEFAVRKGTRQGRLTIRAKLAPGWHIYALTQKAGGPMPSRLAVDPSPDFRLTRPFVADRAPHVTREEVFSVLSEQHEEEVIWTAPLEIAEGVDPRQLKVGVKFSGQVCHPRVGCIPISRQPVEVAAVGDYETREVTEYRPRAVHAVLRGAIVPRSVVPGGVVRLSVTAEPTEGHHVYAYAERDPMLISKPTLIVLKPVPGWTTGAVMPSEPPIEHATQLAEEPVQRYHEGPVTWTVEWRVPPDAAPGGYKLEGLTGFQVCSDTGCDMPSAAEFSAVVEVTKQQADETPEPLLFAPSSSYSAVAKMALSRSAGEGSAAALPSREDASAGGAPPAAAGGGAAGSGGSGSAGLPLGELKPVGVSDRPQSMLVILPTAFFAGFLLNFMPCVLPVIGLKLVSFVHQAGEHRSRIFALNLWYCLGVLFVFMVLATLAVFFGLSWGDQFRSATFNIVLACVVFAFALSFLGVWEIPLPGFVGSQGVSAVAEKEGLVGAFFKGGLSTVLATPCGGPLLGTALTWAVAQPPAITYTGFAFIGLGMASPYLIVGAFPRLIAFLPKPGDWMETFKNIMGFVLIGTVVFILSFIPISLVIPTVATMMGLWAGLWWIGRVPVWDEFHKRMRAWAWGGATAALIAMFSFMWLDGVMESRFQREIDAALSQRMAQLQQPLAAPRASGTDLPWQLYSHARLQEAMSQRRTVLVDFTADWCATCKFNESTALNVAETKKFVEANGIVTLKADMTGEAPEADELKQKLGTKAGLPIYAIFPAAAPDRPILFDGPITTSQVIEALKKAHAISGAATAAAASPRQDTVASAGGAARP